MVARWLRQDASERAASLLLKELPFWDSLRHEGEKRDRLRQLLATRLGFLGVRRTHVHRVFRRRLQPAAGAPTSPYFEPLCCRQLLLKQAVDQHWWNGTIAVAEDTHGFRTVGLKTADACGLL